MYFVKGRYREDVMRRNKLGTGGEMAEEFGELLSVMWTRRFRHVAPRFFKAALSRFAPQFAGTQQQDAQEFAAFLLDGLHEDLNRAAGRLVSPPAPLRVLLFTLPPQAICRSFRPGARRG